MMINKTFAFRPADASKSEFDSADGEVLTMRGVAFGADGALHPARTLIPLTVLPPDHRAVAMHRDRYIIHGAGRLWWLPSDAYDSSEIQSIGEIDGEVTTTASVSDTITVYTATDRYILRYTPEGYLLTRGAVPLPVIAFGMKRVGALQCTDIFSVSGVYMSRSGESASMTHPSAGSHEAEETTHTAGSVTATYRRALTTQAEAKGLFCQPFFVRYALRMSDGSHGAISSPILMLPWVLPPCLGVNVISTGADTTLIQTDFSGCPLFALQYRIFEGITPAHRGLVEAVDIYITRPVDTAIVDGDTADRITTYDRVCGNINRRGHSYESGGNIFAGHYDDGDGTYTDHSLQSLGLGERRVWHIDANPAMADQLRRASDYRLVASIPVSDLTPTADFAPVPLDTGDFTRIDSYPALDDSDRRLEQFGATVATTANGRIYAAASGIKVPPPYPLLSMAEYDGAATAPSSATTVTVTVLTRRSGQIRASTTRCPSISRPRHLYHADPAAYMIIVSNGLQYAAYPLTRHDSLQGAQFIDIYGQQAAGGLGTGVPADLSGIDGDDEGTLLVSATGTTYTRAVSIGTPITGLAPMVTTHIDIGAYDYPIYIFSSRAILALRHTGDSYATRTVSAEGVTAYAAMPRQTAVVTTGGRLMLLSGLKVSEPAITTDRLHPLAGLQQIAGEVVGYNAIDSDTAMVYDRDGDRLVLYPRTTAHPALAGDLAAIDTATGSWHVTAGTITSTIDGCDRVMDGNNTICAFGIPAEPQPMALISRAIKIDNAATTHRLLSLSVLADAAPGHIGMAVYATTDMTRWHLLASSTATTTGALTGSGRTAYIVVVKGSLTADEYVWGLTLSADD